MATHSAAPPPKYWAFVSYSHHDSQWGLWLHRALETYRVPGRLIGRPNRDGGIPARINPVFIDREELPTSASLSRNIEQALKGSRYLIVVCSPHAALSTWVNEEIIRFKRAGGADRVLCLIVAGEPNASDKPELGELECFPQAVRFNITAGGAIGKHRAEPIAADLREGRDGPHRAKMKLIAGLLGVNFDDLMQRERHRRNVRTAAITMAAMMILAVIGSVWYRGHQATVAAEQRQEARMAQLLFQKAVTADQQDDGRTAALYGAAWIEHSLLAGELDGAAGSSLGDKLDLRRKKDFVGSIPTSVVSGMRVLAPNYAGALAASPDGERLIWAQDDGTILVSDAEQTKPLQTLNPGIGRINALAMSDGGLIVAGSQGGAVALRRVETGRWTSLRRTGPAIRAVSFAPDGRALAAAGDGAGVQVWAVGAASLAKPFPTLFGASQDHYQALAFTSEGTRLGAVADGRAGNTFALWNLASGDPAAPSRTFSDVPESLAFSPDGQWMAVGLFDSTVHVSKLGDRTTEKVLAGHARLVGTLAFSPDGRLLASGSDDWTVSLWEVTSWSRIATLTGHSRPIIGLAFANGGRSLVSGSPEDRVLQRWKLPRPLSRATTAAHAGAVRAVQWSPSGDVLASAGDDGVIRLWEPSTLRPRGAAFPRVHTDAVRALAFTLGGRFLVSAGRDGNIVVWDWRARRVVHGPVRGHDRWIFGLSVSPDGKLLATASWDNTVKLWSVPELRPLGRLQDDSGPVGGVAFSPDGRLVASASNDHLVRLWDSNSADASGRAKPLAVLSGHTEVSRALSFTPDGIRVLSGGGDGRIKVWNVRACLAARACRPQSDLIGHYELMVWTLAHSPDGALFVSGSQSNNRQTLRLWDAKRGNVIAYLTGHRDYALTARFSPDGRFLASGGNDGDLRLWRVRDFWPLPQDKDVEASHAFLSFLARPPYRKAQARTLTCRIGAATGLELIGTDAAPADRRAAC